jgi:hypothetical protein
MIFGLNAPVSPSLSNTFVTILNHIISGNDRVGSDGSSLYRRTMVKIAKAQDGPRIPAWDG